MTERTNDAKPRIARHRPLQWQPGTDDRLFPEIEGSIPQRYHHKDEREEDAKHCKVQKDTIGNGFHSGRGAHVADDLTGMDGREYLEGEECMREVRKRKEAKGSVVNWSPKGIGGLVATTAAAWLKQKEQTTATVFPTGCTVKRFGIALRDDVPYQSCVLCL